MPDSGETIVGGDGFKEFVDLQIQQVSQLHQSILEQHHALYRWILAARLTINGGGAVALLGQNAVEGISLVVALSCFFVGIIAAVVGAELDQGALEKGIGPNLQMLGFWIKAKATGQFAGDRMSQLINDAGNLKKFSRPGKIVGNVSLVSFVAGAIIAGCQLLHRICPTVT